MDDDFDELVVAVRADTRAFADDMARMKGRFDDTLLPGLASAGDVLERGLVAAIRRGGVGFDDLRRIATGALDQIAAHAFQLGLDRIFGGIGSGASGGGAGVGGLLTGLFSSLFGGASGLPGRATGGLVAPQRPYLVGERGPELFVPASAGRVEANRGEAGRDVKVAINLAAPRGTGAPVALQRSSRQVASAVRRAMMQG